MLSSFGLLGSSHCWWRSASSQKRYILYTPYKAEYLCSTDSADVKADTSKSVYVLIDLLDRH